ncbi:hypothetical protein [Neolewinella antarctica]|uniref:Outer membrane protein beta-barrel domain-containing protein n=1 Tax=Neolewinella antarctica TaxID=442734 RepID=A0ABX0X7Q0_9BACT|nr:hypothetical protein [Neolewinella antarctica]NJC25253.1 hypothetical protein [Neolewinella antarctica]
MRHLILFFLLIVFSGCVVGQSTDLPPDQPKRWQLAASTGYNLKYLTTDVPEKYSGQYYQATLHYRFRKWLDLGVHFGLSPRASTGVSTSAGRDRDATSSFIFRSADRNVQVGIQPRVNYRIGQGDLSAAITIGTMFHRHTETITNPDLPGEVRIYYQSYVDPYYQFELGYTYWASKSVGVAVSLSKTTQRWIAGSGFVSSDDGLQAYDIDRIDGDLGSFESYFTEVYQPKFKPLNNLFLNVGLTVRPF